MCIYMQVCNGVCMRAVCMHMCEYCALYEFALYITPYATFELHRFGVPLENEFEVIHFFKKIDTWGMDFFHLNDITKGHPLVTTSCAIFRVRIYTLTILLTIVDMISLLVV